MTAPADSTQDAQSAPGAAPPKRARRVWTIGTLSYSTLGLIVLFAWLLGGDFAWQMKERAITPVATLVVKNLHASDFILSLLIVSLPAGLNMIFGPVVSTWSDRHRGRFGRRIPYLLVPTPVVVASIGALAYTPQLGLALHAFLGPDSPGVARCSLVMFAVFWTISEAGAITAQYLFYGLINDVVPKEVVGRFFGLFRAVSLLAGITFNFRVIGYAESHYPAIFLGLAILYAVGFTLMCLMVKEGQYPPPPEPLTTPGEPPGTIASIIAYFRESFSSWHYVLIYIATTLAALAFAPVNSFAVLYAKSIGLGMERYGKYLVLTYIISFILSYPLGSLADRFHPLRVCIVTLVLYTAVGFYGGFFARTPQSFAIAFVAHGVVSGLFYTVQVPVYQRLLPAGKFGQFYSAANLLVGLGFVILPAAIGLMLDATGNVYRYTFLSGGLIAVTAAVTLLAVHARFMRMGGPKGYVAPE